MTDPDREIYPNAPLRLVAFEVRTPQVPEFAARDGALAVYDHLRDLLPVIGQSQATLEFSAGAPTPAISSGPLRMLDRRRVLSATVGASALIVETSDYHRFEEFQEVIERVLDAAARVAKIAGLERIGLRYIDEIRVPGLQKSGDWDGYINRTLLAGLDLGTEYEPASTQGLAEYEVSAHMRANLRFGTLTGRVVDSGGPLRIDPVEEGPFFLVDIDSFWTAPDDELPEFSRGAVVEILLSLRQPVRTLFEASITERLREEVLRKESP